MIRIILWNLLLFALPFMLVAGWLQWVHRIHPGEAQKRVWAITALFAAMLVLASLGGWRMTRGDAPEGRYVPPTLENGEVIPGHFE